MFSRFTVHFILSVKLFITLLAMTVFRLFYFSNSVYIPLGQNKVYLFCIDGKSPFCNPY